MASTPVRLLSLLGAALLATSPVARAADALPEDVRFQTETLLTGLPQPMHLEFAPDGSLYFIDWHNPLIGHMQHNARDPNRDHERGRIYRITYPERPLVKPAQIAGASVAALLDVLKEPEYRTRYRARRELRGHSPAEVRCIGERLCDERTWAYAAQRRQDKANLTTENAKVIRDGLATGIPEVVTSAIRVGIVRLERTSDDVGVQWVDAV